MKRIILILVFVMAVLSVHTQNISAEPLYVLFPPNSASLTGVNQQQAVENVRVFTEIARILLDNPQYRVLIDGHANPVMGSSREERDVLAQLSLRRAMAAANFLVEYFNVDRQRLIISSAGGRYSIYGNAAQNRRVNFQIIAPPVSRPSSGAALPSAILREIAYRSVKVGETTSLADIVMDRNVVMWTSSTPSTVSVDSSGNITGLRIGSGYITINEIEYISVAVVPGDDFFMVPESDVFFLPEDSVINNRNISDFTEYRTEPTFRLAYRFNNKGETKGASGSNGGIDILGRGPDYEWLWTTYYQGGWFYDLNGVQREMINGFQRDTTNGVELTVIPEFVYDKGVTYLQLRQIVHNTGTSRVTGQRFGASADVMIHNNDHASLLLMPYGAYMTDSSTDPSLELMFVCLAGDGIDAVDTLWLGEYYQDVLHLEYIYEDRRSSISGVDSAIGFSYQNIDLAPGEEREFIVRFTLARTED